MIWAWRISRFPILPFAARLLAFASAPLLLLPFPGSARAEIDTTPRLGSSSCKLSDLDLTLVDQGWGFAHKDRSVSDKQLRIGGRTFKDGIGTHADSRMILHLAGGARRFQSFVGLDDNAGDTGSVCFIVQGDGRELWRSEIMRRNDPAVAVSVDVSNVQYLTLLVDGANDGIGEDHANWAEALLTGVTRQPTVVSRLPEEQGFVFPGGQWTDTDGNLIQAHGGGVMHFNNRYYWYGEDRSKGYVAIGVSGYVSDDLVNWKHIGVVLPRSAYDEKHRDQNICERPKVIYNPTTRKFVMWFHYDRSGYGDSQAGVAIADRPEGPFRYLGEHRPVERSTFRDMGVFVDDDNRAYVFYAGEGNQTMHVVRLNREWTGEEKPMVEGKTWARIHERRARESPAVFKYDGKYYLFTSGTTGWAPNPADLSVADNILGPYRSLGNPCVGPNADKTHFSQNTWIFPAPGKPPGHFIYMGDRWRPYNLADSRYVWLPFQIEGEGLKLEWVDRWKPDEL